MPMVYTVNGTYLGYFGAPDGETLLPGDVIQFNKNKYRIVGRKYNYKPSYLNNEPRYDSTDLIVEPV